MKIYFWGAARTVTGSAHYLSVNGKMILLDFGLFQGRRKEANQINRSFRFPAKDVDAVVLSHAHIDHSGNLPNLVKHGFEGPIYTTSATAHLCELMLKDSGRIQESDAKFVNKWRARKGKPLIEPLYTENDAAKTIPLFEKKALNKPFEIAPGVRVSLIEAGHILGSAAVVVDVEEKNRTQRLWFSGDIGRPNLPILEDPVLPFAANTLIMECTYGDRPHQPYEQAYQELRDTIAQTLTRGGKVIIPAFAVGRTQELVYAIHQMMDAGEIPSVPVFVDSPLAVNVSDVFRKLPEFFDAEARAMIKNDKHGAALGFDMLTYVRSVEESKALNQRTDPMIIISASGMMEVGRVLHHLRHNIHDPNSTVLIVSWMAPHTLGRRLVEGRTRVKIYGEVYERKIGVKVINGFSAHGGQDFLVDYAMNVKGRVQDIFLVHGEERGAVPLMEKLRAGGLDNLHYPNRDTMFEL
ncbi:MAG TPA: MBL fold metallo-hydrolase [Anaerolineales bacterium]|nr:MBL fold metallo-hydrolase [Anaerolineales bacterium]